MKNVVILEVERYNELMRKINRLENEKKFLINENKERTNRLNLWNKKIDEIDEKFRGLFDTIIREDFIGTDEVTILDINDRDKIAEYINDNLKLEFNELKEEKQCKQ